MEAVTLVGLAKVLEKSAKAQRDAVVPGKYAVDEELTLHVKGAVAVAEDAAYTPTADIPLKAALALFLRYSGITGPAAMDALVRAMKEAAAMNDEALKAIREMADLDAAEKAVNDALGELPKKSRRGAVKATLEVIEVRPLAKAVPEKKAANAA